MARWAAAGWWGPWLQQTYGERQSSSRNNARTPLAMVRASSSLKASLPLREERAGDRVRPPPFATPAPAGTARNDNNYRSGSLVPEAAAGTRGRACPRESRAGRLR